MLGVSASSGVKRGEQVGGDVQFTLKKLAVLRLGFEIPAAQSPKLLPVVGGPVLGCLRCFLWPSPWRLLRLGLARPPRATEETPSNQPIVGVLRCGAVRGARWGVGR